MVLEKSEGWIRMIKKTGSEGGGVCMCVKVLGILTKVDQESLLFLPVSTCDKFSPCSLLFFKKPTQVMV